jgi:hypothetical protein
MLWLAMKVMPWMTKWRGTGLTLDREDSRLSMRWRQDDTDMHIDIYGPPCDLRSMLMNIDWRKMPTDDLAGDLRKFDPEGEGTRWRTVDD